jgi:hypothetical protein
MWNELAHPGIGGPFDRSSSVGWGVAGLFSSIVERQRLFAIAVLALTAGRLVTLALRSRTGRVLAVAVVVNAGVAFALASWYQALRLDYWGLGLVPLAVGAGAGTRALGRRRTSFRFAAVGVAVALVAALAAWNATREVAPSLDRSGANARAVAAIEAHVPRDAFVVTSLFLAGRLADDGYTAEPGFAALLHGHLRSGAYVTSDAFHLTEAQLRTLGVADPMETLRTTLVARIGSIELRRVIR